MIEIDRYIERERGRGEAEWREEGREGKKEGGRKGEGEEETGISIERERQKGLKRIELLQISYPANN